jgi:hypothetical protein
VYAGQVQRTPDKPADQRVPVTFRIRRASRDRVDAIAAAHTGWDRTEALRHLFVLGLAAYDAEQHPARPAPKRR